MMTGITISTIIPVFNGEQFLGDAIQSVMAQTLLPNEIIVVDDGSTEGCAKVISALAATSSLPIRYFYQENQGSAAARNLGVSHTMGNLLAFLDADDLWLPDKLARQRDCLYADPSCEAVLGRVENFLSPELEEAQRRTLVQAAQRHGDVHVGALLIRRAAFLRVGQFDVRWRYAEFVDWWARATQHGLAVTTLPDLVLRRRIHANNLTRRERGDRREYLAMLRQQLVQRRSLSGSTDHST